MTEEQYFYLKLAEEASEIAHMCSKIMQFGLSNMVDNTQPDNERRLYIEIDDFLGVLNYMREIGIISYKESKVAQDQKVDRVLEYLKISRNNGLVEDTRSKECVCPNCDYVDYVNLEDPTPLCTVCNHRMEEYIYG